ncbi:hypothetical protein GCM10027028_18560 [Streptomyces sundarbansensis]
MVPGGDERAHADRLVDDPAEDVGAHVHDPAAVLVGDLAEVAEGVRHILDVDPGLGQGFAGVEGLGAGDLLPVAQQQVVHTEQHVGTAAGGGAGPVGLLEGPPGGAYRAVDVVGVGLVDGGDDGGVEGVDHLAPAAGRRGCPLAADVQLAHPGSPSCPAGAAPIDSTVSNMAQTGPPTYGTHRDAREPVVQAPGRANGGAPPGVCGRWASLPGRGVVRGRTGHRCT